MLDVGEMNGDPESDDIYDPKNVRYKKNYAVLSSRNRNRSHVQHFDDVPVDFLPDILSLIQQYSKYHVLDHAPYRSRPHPPPCVHDVKSLSVVYEIMRFWDKAFSAYESLCAADNYQRNRN